MHYHEKIKELREDNDKTQAEIAEVIGTSQSYYAQYERGARSSPFERVAQIAEIYGVSLDWIAGRSNQKYLAEKEK